ncbi:UvrD-helicase domain-containing protein [Flavobacterium sp. CF136]|uniref:UvrD-helicase domain-containing protein n=1 Tax=Flavobacterium sp. (strain CF136) TaxID=1144313 RepID=UPI0002716B9B|nr:UvrD-helicase domain-containing protein [Flavobacterium sp. CF136]EJL64074.1 DNA/RNA helicase, superfamily I [Flavobacterium sp. CF136]
MECAKFIDNPGSVLFCAFNNSISNEISRKFKNLGLNEITVKTLHSLGWHILNANNSTGHPITLEENKYRELLKKPELQEKLAHHIEKILSINGFEKDSLDENKKFAANNLVYKINNRLIDINQKYRATLTKDTIEDFKQLVIHFGIFNNIEISKKNFDQELKYYFESHKIILEDGNLLSAKTMAIDYTDMLYLPVQWNQQPPNKFDFVFIDECQDLSKSQFAIATKYGKKDCRILAVGDPRQSIYGFTGADIESFQRIKDWTKAKQLPLTICFRCPKKVIEIAKTIRHDIIGNKEDEGIVTSILFDEVTKIAKPGDLIISRLRAPIVLLVFNFIDNNIKVQIHEEEVREIINELKNIFKSNELNIIISTLPEGFDTLKKEILNRWKWVITKNAERIIDSTERKIYIESEQSYLEKKLSFLQKKYYEWIETCPNLTAILKNVKDFISATDNSIKISTIHRAKGLENERVFIINYNDLPFNRLEQKDWEKTQELNLKYVAVTRALKELFLIETKNLQAIKDEGSLFDTLPF